MEQRWKPAPQPDRTEPLVQQDKSGAVGPAGQVEHLERKTLSMDPLGGETGHERRWAARCTAMITSTSAHSLSCSSRKSWLQNHSRSS